MPHYVSLPPSLYVFGHVLLVSMCLPACLLTFYFIPRFCPYLPPLIMFPLSSALFTVAVCIFIFTVLIFPCFFPYCVSFCTPFLHQSFSPMSFLPCIFPNLSSLTFLSQFVFLFPLFVCIPGLNSRLYSLYCMTIVA